MLRKISGIHSAYSALSGFLNYVRSWRSPFLRLAPAGHYLSPIPSIDEIQKHAEAFFDLSVKTLPGIDLNLSQQIALLEAFSPLEGDFLYSKNNKTGLRYAPDNAYFPPADALILYCFLRHFKPGQIIEIGSGFSSAVILDTNDHFLQESTRLTFIEPNPKRLYELLRPDDSLRSTIIENSVQSIQLDTFKTLKSGDILFIDSSHMLKIGSDISYLIFEVLPALESGVLIHFHDVFWPFEYPKTWYEQGFCFNEDYLLHSFLQFNEKFSIAFFTSYLQIHQTEAVNTYLPLLAANSGCSLWLVKK